MYRCIFTQLVQFLRDVRYYKYRSCLIEDAVRGLFFQVQICVASYSRVRAFQGCALFKWDSAEHVYYSFN